MASGWNLWVWLQCIGVACGCCCKEVYRYPSASKQAAIVSVLKSLIFSILNVFSVSSVITISIHV